MPVFHFWGDSLEVEINMPAHLVPSVRGSYSSSSCQNLTFSNFSWMGGVVAISNGYEVIVSFLDGDPDRSIVTGRNFIKVNLGGIAIKGR